MFEELKPVGYFSDLSYGEESQEPLSMSRGKLTVDSDELEKIVAYLKNGVELAVTSGWTEDIFQPKKIIGVGAILTDGIWEWHSDLPYYVEHYRAQLPEIFINHLRTNDWKIDKSRADEVAHSLSEEV